VSEGEGLSNVALWTTAGPLGGGAAKADAASENTKANASAGSVISRVRINRSF
jgi:hypothetical protein